MLGPFATASRRTPIHQVSLPVLSHAACASMSTTTTTTTTTTRDRGDHYGPMEWAKKQTRRFFPGYNLSENRSQVWSNAIWYMHQTRGSTAWRRKMSIPPIQYYTAYLNNLGNCGWRADQSLEDPRHLLCSRRAGAGPIYLCAWSIVGHRWSLEMGR